MPDKVTETLRAFLTAPQQKTLGPRVVLAVSGGADSVALLRAAAKLRSRWDFLVLHCDHGLRGRASTADAAFVVALCERLGLPCQVQRTRLAQGTGIETRARAWRRRCYADAARAFKSKLVLLAQHQEDQAETLLLNLLRGAGLRGAGAMAPLAPLGGTTHVQLGRPFLECAPQGLRAWLRRLRQPWREDVSNQRADNPRNLLRLRVMPLLKKLRPDASERLAAFAKLARKDEARLTTRANKSDPRALRAWVARLRPRPAFNQGLVARLRALLTKGHGSTSLGSGWLATCSVGRLRATRAKAGTDLASALPQALRLGKDQRWGGWLVRATLLVRPKSLLAKDRFYFDPAVGKRGLVLIPPKPGSRLQPFGMRGSRKVVDLLRDAKVPSWQRANWPLLAIRTRQLIAVLGVRQGQNFAVAGNCQRVLCVSWKKP